MFDSNLQNKTEGLILWNVDILKLKDQTETISEVL